MLMKLKDRNSPQMPMLAYNGNRAKLISGGATPADQQTCGHADCLSSIRGRTIAEGDGSVGNG